MSGILNSSSTLVLLILMLALHQGHLVWELVQWSQSQGNLQTTKHIFNPGLTGTAYTVHKWRLSVSLDASVCCERQRICLAISSWMADWTFFWNKIWASHMQASWVISLRNSSERKQQTGLWEAGWPWRAQTHERDRITWLNQIMVSR